MFLLLTNLHFLISIYAQKNYLNRKLYGVTKITCWVVNYDAKKIP